MNLYKVKVENRRSVEDKRIFIVELSDVFQMGKIVEKINDNYNITEIVELRRFDDAINIFDWQ